MVLGIFGRYRSRAALVLTVNARAFVRQASELCCVDMVSGVGPVKISSFYTEQEVYAHLPLELGDQVEIDRRLEVGTSEG